jgi:hypothetical protein
LHDAKERIKFDNPNTQEIEVRFKLFSITEHPDSMPPMATSRFGGFSAALDLG